MHHKKKINKINKIKCSCQSPVFTSGVPRYSMIKGFVVVTNWIRTSTSGSKRQAQRTTIHSDRDFVYPVPLAAKRYIRAARMDLLTLLVDQLQS